MLGELEAVCLLDQSLKYFSILHLLVLQLSLIELVLIGGEVAHGQVAIIGCIFPSQVSRDAVS